MSGITPLVVGFMLGSSVGYGRSGCAPEPYQAPGAEVNSVPPPVPVDLGQTERLDWLGRGAYFLDADHCWRAQRVYRGLPLRTTFLNSPFESPCPLFDAESAIRRSVAAIGLPVVDSYSNLVLAQCQALAQIAERWRISYSYSQYTLYRFFMRDQHPYSMVVRFTGDPRSTYHQPDKKRKR